MLYTGLPTENVPRELATCFREVLDNGWTIYAEPYGEQVPSPSPWPEQHEIGVGVNLPCSYIITSGYRGGSAIYRFSFQMFSIRL